MSDTTARTHRVVLYSDDPAVRDSVRVAVGRRPTGDLGRLEWVECTTGAQVLKAVDAGGVDLAVLDGEAWPTGGLGLAKQLYEAVRAQGYGRKGTQALLLALETLNGIER